MAHLPSSYRRDAGRDGSGWLLTRETAGNILLVAMMIAILWGGIWWHLGQLYRDATAQAAHDSGNLARAAAESVDQTITNVDDTLRTMRAVYASDPQRFDIGVWASRVNRTNRVALEYVTIDRNGLLTASSLGPVGAPIDFSNQPFFKTQRGSPEDHLFISQPFLGRASGRWSVLFTRKLATADGWFSGIIAASADASWLTRLHQALEIGHGSLMLIGTDGVIRALSIGGHSEFGPGVGQNIAQSPVLQAVAKTSEGDLSWTNPVDHTQQIVSFRRLDRYPLIVAVGLNTAEVIAPYHQAVRQYEIFGLCLTALIVLAGCLLITNTRRLLISREVLRNTVNAVSQGIIMVDRRGRIPVINRRAGELLRLPAPLTRSDPVIESIVDWRESGEQPKDDVVRRNTGTQELVLEVHTHALPDGSTVRTYADITEREKAAAAIAHLAHHDDLTDLANRRLLIGRLEAATSRAKRTDEGCTVLCIDIDGFALVNDLHGHVFGDRVLRQAARRIEELAGPADTVARLEGDAFCVLRSDHPAKAVSFAERILAAIHQPYRVDGQEVLLSASIGIALCPSDGASADELLTNADTALYHAKAAGRNSYRFYDPDMDVRTTQRRQLEQELRDALERQELSVFYQPIFDSMTCRPVGFEALARWQHPTRGFIPPDAFIPVAEESGLIVPLGQWVMETACREAACWPEPLRVSVNLSPKQFLLADLADNILTALADSGLPARRLSVEITEGVLIDNRERARTTIQALKRQGVRISLDDFGTGYSGLSYLRQYPFDTIKIDKSFVRSLADDGPQAIVQTVLTLARRLGVNVIAEGVETREQLRWLRAAGCGQIQGFLLGGPMLPEEIDSFLARTEMAQTAQQQIAEA
ncbi:MAG TPA: EAL domain-containing protein [Rhodopila sp.]|uniref:bifunctional diguanylate cyclase/phosphodiesterase n=1 Tax=Rhodopila sp. TaxID=2480087 RepID=UPI002D0C748C|nr:EAL domain-containing protein [Rhodopila sp.]HVY17212.1 EAL domain-containing protein [Rhodopila sp.]